MDFNLYVHCDSDAFADDNLRHETARILVATAARVLAGDGDRYETIRDVNGNDVGRFKFVGE